MRITMISIGSMGDVRPYIVLGRELTRRGHEITICAFSAFEKAVQSEGFRFKPISGDAKTFMANIMKPGASGVNYLKQIRDTMIAFIEPFLSDLEAACEDAQAIIGTYFGQVFQSIAEVRHVPFFQTHYYPMDKNNQTPIASAPGQHAGKGWNIASYQVGYLLISTLEKYYLADWREARGMSPRKLEAQPKYELNGHIIPVLYAISPLILPRPKSWGANIHMTGYWMDDQITDFEPDPKLTAFLEDGEPPIYIGFGSMTGNDMGETLAIVLEAVKRSGVRAVLSTGWGEATVPECENVFVAEGYVPHDWLFAHVSAVVHHGGAGTTAAGIQAGKPTLVIPFGGDQPFWATRVNSLGLGPKPIARDKLTTAKLTKALTQLTTQKSYRVAAKELGERLRLEKGEVNAANVIEHELRKWLREEGREPDLFAHNQTKPQE